MVISDDGADVANNTTHIENVTHEMTTNLTDTNDDPVSYTHLKIPLTNSNINFNFMVFNVVNKVLIIISYFKCW